MIHGILNVWKEKGYTSHDVVASLRKILDQRKIGHTGTLDPEAEGVLPLCLGKGTRLSGMLTDRDKVYETVLLLGRETDTQDATGQTLYEKDPSPLTQAEIQNCIQGYIGRIQQVPPMYSALKHQGKRLYELAREGKTVERQSRPVRIYEIQILGLELPRVRMRIHCSKGTYIRTLCHDIGRTLGVGGCMESLVRLRAGGFSAEESHTLEEIRRAKEDGRLEELVLPVDTPFLDLPAFHLRPEAEKAGRNGNPLPREALAEQPEELPGTSLRLYDGRGRFYGIYRKTSKGELGPEKMFYSEEG